MSPRLHVVLCATLLGLIPETLCLASGSASATSLWCRQPAQKWTAALPVGNGRTGAMVFGGVAPERLQLNEDSVWSGAPQDADHPDAFVALPEIRRLLWAGQHREADASGAERLVCKGAGSGHGSGAKVPFGCCQTLGDLQFTFDGLDEKTATDYRRDLDLATALATVRFQQGEVTYTRRLFDRVRRDWGETAAAKLPTDERLVAFRKGGEDPSLSALCFQFGRYLLIGSSRPGEVPANLQGIWADGNRALIKS